MGSLPALPTTDITTLTTNFGSGFHQKRSSHKQHPKWPCNYQLKNTYQRNYLGTVDASWWPRFRQFLKTSIYLLSHKYRDGLWRDLERNVDIHTSLNVNIWAQLFAIINIIMHRICSSAQEWVELLVSLVHEAISYHHLISSPLFLVSCHLVFSYIPL